MTASPWFGGRLKNMNCSCFDYGIELYLGKGAPMHGPDYGMEIYLGELGSTNGPDDGTGIYFWEEDFMVWIIT